MGSNVFMFLTVLLIMYELCCVFFCVVLCCAEMHECVQMYEEQNTCIVLCCKTNVHARATFSTCCVVCVRLSCVCWNAWASEYFRNVFVASVLWCVVCCVVLVLCLCCVVMRYECMSFWARMHSQCFVTCVVMCCVVLFFRDNRGDSNAHNSSWMTLLVLCMCMCCEMSCCAWILYVFSALCCMVLCCVQMHAS
jgi:hypothetical protein